MKLLHLCLAAGALIPLATSCSQDAPWSTGGGETGKISLKLKADHSVATATRANDAESPVKPEAEEFAIRLENSDGSYVKEWETLGKFNDEEGFPRGNYTVTASYGSIDEQGFSKPHYVGTEQVTVVPGESSNHSITATLANSMVSIRYTDSFMNHFSSYNASVVAEGIATPVAFGRTETRPAYVKPGEITVNFNIKSPEGQEVTVSPAKFIAQPRRHYIITANVKGAENNGTGVLEVLFEENVQHETEEILLTDDLFTSTPPEITVHGFEVDSTIETFESVAIDSNPEFHIVAFGGIKQAKFTVELLDPDGKLPAFEGEVDLANASATDQVLVEQSGLKCYGLFKQSADSETGSKMAVINMKEFVENLSAGEYKISLSVKDALGRINPVVTRTRADGEVEENPVSFIAKINRINFELKEDVAPRFMADSLSVIISTNYAGALDGFSFETEDRNGNMQKAKILSKKDVPSETADSYSRRYVLKTDNIDDTDWTVTAFYPNKDSQSVTLWAAIPEYNVEVDAFANKIMLKVVPKDPNDLQWMTEKMKFQFGNQGVLSDGLVRDTKTGIITVENTEQETRFIPGTEYTNFHVTFGNNSAYHSTPVPFTTEAATEVPNGDFEDLVETINTTISQGGEWTITVAGEHRKTTLSMAVSEPRHWSTSNSQTCNLNASNVNSWFTIPSVYNTSLVWKSNQPKVQVGITYQKAHSTTASIYSDNTQAPKGSNAMVIRNVAWDNNGTTPDVDKKTGSTDSERPNYYCSNIPSIANRTRGSLILGEGDKEGIDFSSRPMILKGKYKYYTDNNDPNEKGLVTVNILSGNQIIGSGKIELKGEDNYKEFKCYISYVEDIFLKKATSLQISIYSSNKESEIKTTNYCNKDECCSRGASLFIDALEFEY